MSRYPKKTLYYESRSQDFFKKAQKEKGAQKPFDYANNRLGFRLLSFILHRIVAPPFAHFYAKVFLREKIIGRAILKAAKREGRGFILVGNHTQPIGDAFGSNLVAFPTRAHVVVHPDNLSLPVIGRLTPYLGAIPTPGTLREARQFSEAVAEKLSRGRAVVIFPEAHVWPFYTGLRPFKSGALDPAVRAGVPAFCFSRVYKKSRLFGFKCCVFIDGPFYPCKSLSRRDAEAKLSRELFAAMEARVRESDVQVYDYKERTCEL